MRSAAQSYGKRSLRDRNELIILLMYDTGLRCNELTTIERDDIVLDAGDEHVYLPGDKQKDYPIDDASPSDVPIEFHLDETGIKLKSYLSKERWRESDYLFPSESSDHISNRQVRNLIKKIAIEAGVEPQSPGAGTERPDDVSPHTLRHSLAYRMLIVEDYTMVELKKRLRHTSIKTTDQIYTHLNPV